MPPLARREASTGSWWGGEGLFRLPPDERATLANMATECSARGAVMEVDEVMLEWIAERRPGVSIDALRGKVVTPDPGAAYAGGVHRIDLADIGPMVATPGDPDHGVPSDPKNGATIGEMRWIDIAYGGSCTAGKRDDIDFYARVMAGRRGRPVGGRWGPLLPPVRVDRRRPVRAERGYTDLFRRTGVG